MLMLELYSGFMHNVFYVQDYANILMPRDLYHDNYNVVLFGWG